VKTALFKDALQATAIVATLTSTIVPAASAQTASLDLLARATNPNPTLNSYTASAQLSARLHAVISVHKTFGGTVYYLRPNRKIAFQNVPASLSKFKDLVSSTPSYVQATEQYTITPLTDDGTLSKYTLFPKKSDSRVKSVDVAIDDNSALLQRAQWHYTNGGSLAVDQTYENVGIYRLPSKANVSARFPSYSVDGVLTFSNYQPNAAVSPSVFATPH
jgi:hypothetical protein